MFRRSPELGRATSGTLLSRCWTSTSSGTRGRTAPNLFHGPNGCLPAPPAATPAHVYQDQQRVLRTRRLARRANGHRATEPTSAASAGLRPWGQPGDVATGFRDASPCRRDPRRLEVDRRTEGTTNRGGLFRHRSCLQGSSSKDAAGSRRDGVIVIERDHGGQSERLGQLAIHRKATVLVAEVIEEEILGARPRLPYRPLAGRILDPTMQCEALEALARPGGVSSANQDENGGT